MVTNPTVKPGQTKKTLHKRILLQPMVQNPRVQVANQLVKLNNSPDHKPNKKVTNLDSQVVNNKHQLLLKHQPLKCHIQRLN